MADYMKRLFETDVERQARLSQATPKKAKRKQKKTPIRVAPTKPRVGLGNTINALERRKRMLRDL